jgi:hypothetical protein
MPALAELIDQAAAERLALVRAEAEQRERAAAATPVQPVCKACGRRLDPPAVKFSGATGERS